MKTKKNEPIIKGYYGCYCHPFESWEECEKFHKQKISNGTKVKNRHSGKIGIVIRQETQRGFVIVKYGPNPCDEHLEHVSELIKHQEQINSLGQLQLQLFK